MSLSVSFISWGKRNCLSDSLSKKKVDLQDSMHTVVSDTVDKRCANRQRGTHELFKIIHYTMHYSMVLINFLHFATQNNQFLHIFSRSSREVSTRKEDRTQRVLWEVKQIYLRDWDVSRHGVYQ
jgi:hypothetical protein